MDIISNLHKIKIQKATVVTIGNFDGIHIGHEDIINKTVKIAKEKKLKSVLFSFSNHPVNFFRKDKLKNLMTLKDKCAYIKRLGIDVFINVPFNENIIKLSPKDYVNYILINKLNAKEIIVGHDFKFGTNRCGDANMLSQFGKDNNFNVTVINPIKIVNTRVSSTLIRNLLQDGNVADVKKYLGRNYSVTGKVIHGKKIGRKLGFPTINMKIDEDILIPKVGVYQSIVKIKDKFYIGATNIGYNPTIENSSFSVETYILNYEGNLYNRKIELFFIRRLRDEVKFNSVDELRIRLAKDIEDIKEHAFNV